MTATLLQYLDRKRFQPTLVLVRSTGEWLADVPTDVQVIELGAPRLALAWWPLARLLRREKPDVVFSTSTGTNPVAALAYRLAGRPGRLVLSERTVVMRSDNPAKSRITLPLKRALYRYAHRVTTVSQGVKDQLVAYGIAEPARVRVTYNPVVTDEMLELANEPVPHAWFAEPIPIILAAGRLEEVKGFDMLIRALARVRAAAPARLVILGEGPQRDSLKALARELGIGDDVDLPGFDKNPYRYMKQATVFALSSRNEGLPGALIQAMACGAAVVSTDCPVGPSEIVTEGVDGYLVPVDDPVAMGDRIARLLADPAERARLGKAAALSARGRYEADVVMQRYVDALSDSETEGSW